MAKGVASISFDQYVRRAVVTGWEWFTQALSPIKRGIGLVAFLGVTIVPTVLIVQARGRIGYLWTAPLVVIGVLACAVVGAYRMFADSYSGTTIGAGSVGVPTILTQTHRKDHPEELGWITSHEPEQLIPTQGLRVKRLYFSEPRELKISSDDLPVVLRLPRFPWRRVLRVRRFPDDGGISIQNYKSDVSIRVELYEES